jgi:TPR repeat protein
MVNRKRIVLMVLALLLLPHVASAGPLEDGKAAYARGDFETAIKLWLPLANHGNVEAQRGLGQANGAENFPEAMKWYRKAADQGDADSQYSIGAMYDHGWGVKQDYAEALKWFRKAGDQEYVPALDYLGTMYRDGHGVKQDNVQAYMCFSLAVAKSKSERGAQFLAQDRDGIAAKMTPQQIAESKRLAAAWKPIPARTTSKKP